MRTRRNRRRRFLKIFLPAIIPFVVCLSLLAIPSRISDRMKLVISWPLAPVQKASLVAGSAVTNAFLWIPRSWNASSKMMDLEGEVFLLENILVAQRATMDRQKTELASVTKYYKGNALSQKPLLANVVAFDTSAFRRSMLIDVGSRDGVTENSMVIADSALVGRVTSVGTSTSRVLLITDPASKIPARILETEDVGVLEGASGNVCRLKYLSRWGEKVEKGYKVVSSSIGGVFPDAIFIATVVEDIDGEGTPYKTLVLRPKVNATKVNTVMVIKR